MEEIVKMQIQKLRKNGMGLRTIAKYTKQPITSIRYYADKVTPPEKATEEGLIQRMEKKEACFFCGDTIEQPSKGRKRRSYGEGTGSVIYM